MSDYKVGDRFVITIDKIYEQDGEKLFRANGMKTLVFDERGLKKLESIKEFEERSHKSGLHDAWELARVLYSETSPEELREILSMDGESTHIPFSYALRHYKAEEIAKLYEDWSIRKKKEEQGIMPGDIVQNDLGHRAVVLKVDHRNGKDMAYILFDDGSAGFHCLTHMKKVNRKVDIYRILSAVKGEGYEQDSTDIDGRAGENRIKGLRILRQNSHWTV